MFCIPHTHFLRHQVALMKYLMLILCLKLVHIATDKQHNSLLSNTQTPPRRVSSHPLSLEILSHLWNLEVHYCVHNSLPLYPILSQPNPILTLISYYLMAISNLSGRAQKWPWTLVTQGQEMTVWCLVKLNNLHLYSS